LDMAFTKSSISGSLFILHFRKSNLIYIELDFKSKISKSQGPSGGRAKSRSSMKRYNFGVRGERFLSLNQVQFTTESTEIFYVFSL